MEINKEDWKDQLTNLVLRNVDVTTEVELELANDVDDFVEKLLSEQEENVMKNKLEEARNTLKVDVAQINLITGEITK